MNFGKMLEETLKTEEGIKKATSRKLVPAGRYAAILSKVEQHKSADKASQAEAYRFTYLITEGEQTGEEVREDVYFKNRAGGLTEFAQKTIIRRLQTFGYTNEMLKTFRSPDESKPKDVGDFVKVIGKPVSITVENKVIGGTGPSAGQAKAEIARVESPASATSEAA